MKLIRFIIIICLTAKNVSHYLILLSTDLIGSKDLQPRHRYFYKKIMLTILTIFKAERKTSRHVFTSIASRLIMNCPKNVSYTTTLSPSTAKMNSNYCVSTVCTVLPYIKTIELCQAKTLFQISSVITNKCLKTLRKSFPELRQSILK